MNINKICVYNVGFGDCSLLELNNSNILVDCGGNIDRTEQLLLVNDIANKSINKQFECVVTHFHGDHYNIFPRFHSNTFDAIYAPNFFTTEEIKLQLYALLILSVSSSGYYMAEKMLRFIPDLIDKGILKKNAHVNFVKRGDYINNRDIKVLWPNIPAEEVKDVIADFERIISNNDISERIDQLSNRYLEQIERFIHNDNFQSQELLYDLISTEINRIIEELKSLKKEINAKLIRNIPKKKLKQIQNKYSIVFHSEKILFLGDIPSDIFNENIACNVCDNRYSYIKVAHHGTKNYFTKQLPKSDYMIIFSGRKYNCDLSAMYPLYYNDRKFICTNNDYCEYYNANIRDGFLKSKLICNGICGIRTVGKEFCVK